MGDISAPTTITLTNAASTPDTITGFTSTGNDYDTNSNCVGTLATVRSCSLDVVFIPGAPGSRPESLAVHDGSPDPVIISLSGTGTEGYDVASSNGSVSSYGDANNEGGAAGTLLKAPIVGMASSHDDRGYWLVASDGGVFSYGDAGFYGSTGGLELNKPIVGMAATPDGQRLLAGGRGRGNLQLRRRRVLRSTGASI